MLICLPIAPHKKCQRPCNRVAPSISIPMPFIGGITVWVCIAEINRVFNYMPPPHFRLKVVCKMRGGGGGRGEGSVLTTMVVCFSVCLYDFAGIT